MSDDRAFERIRLADIFTYLTVYRTRNVTAAARELAVTASQVSKAIGRLEEAVRAPLLIRGAKGVVPTPEATVLVPRLEEMIAQARGLGGQLAPEDRLSVAAPSYLCNTLVAAVIRAKAASQVRCMEVGPAFIRAYATENLFQLALTLGPQPLTSIWTSERIGSVRSGLFGTRRIAKQLGTDPSVTDIAQVPFIIPLYNADGQFVPSDDACPLPREDRKQGHEAATYGVALEMAAQADMLVFGPITGAEAHVHAGRLVEIHVPGWDVQSDAYLHINSNRVLKSTLNRILRALTDELKPKQP